MSSMRRAQIPLYPEEVPRCLDHGRDTVQVCVKCDNVFVCDTCLTSSHQGHNVANFDEIATGLKTSQLKHIIETGSVLLRPKLVSLKENTKDLQERKHAQFKDNIQKIRENRDYLKKLIDEEAERSVKNNSYVYEMDKEELKTDIDHYQDCLLKLDKLVVNSKESLKSNNSLSVIQKAGKLQKQWEILCQEGGKTVTTNRPFGNWRQCEITKEQISKALGFTDYSEIWLNGNDVPLPRSSNHIQPSRMIQIGKHPGRSVCSIAPLNEDLIWILLNHRDLVLVDHSGNTFQSVTIIEGINDITALSNNILMAACQDNMFRKVKMDGSVKEAYNTGTFPLDCEGYGTNDYYYGAHNNNVNCISADHFDNVFAGVRWDDAKRCHGKLGVYCPRFDENGIALKASLFRYVLSGNSINLDYAIQNPYRICLDRLTGGIAVLESNDLTNETTGIMYDWQWNEKIRFSRETDGNDVTKEDFRFNDICFDKNNNLIVVEGSTNSVFVFNLANFQVRRFKLDHAVYSACTLPNGKLWLGSKNGLIMVVDI